MFLSQPKGPFALVILSALMLAAVAPHAAADTAATFSGRVIGTDGATPRAGVVVALVDEGGTAAFRSQPTSNDGAFRIEEAASGSYRLLVEAPEGAFLATGDVDVREGANPPLALTLAAPAALQDHGLGSGTGPGLSKWARWLIAGGIGVAAIFVIDEIGEDVEEPASPF